MSLSSEVSPLRIANEAFMVASTIERCPRPMMLRELVMNALEAAAGATDAPGRVHIDSVSVDGVAKLRLWNTGRGLAADELLRITDLSSSLFKTVGLDGNFGIGAKAASLASNRHGLRYRSCRKGRVWQVTLGERGGVYGRLWVTAPDGSRHEVVDVTDAAEQEGVHPLYHDWTEVVLLGNAPDQDTAREPFAGSPAVSPTWVLDALGKRFFRLPEGVALTVDLDGGPQRFRSPFAARHFDRFEEVVAAGGVRLHYGFRAADSAREPGPAMAYGLGAVISNGEIYALTQGSRWLLEAPNYGLTFAARRVSVLIELPADFEVRPEQYRQFLRFTEGEQHQVTFADFGALVRENIPGWLMQIIQSMQPDADDYLSEINSDIAALLDELGIELDPRPKSAAPKPPEATSASEDDPDASDDPSSQPPLSGEDRQTDEDEEAPRADTTSLPEIVVLEDAEQIAEKALGGRAARYYPSQRKLFVNARYEAFLRLTAQLQEEFAAVLDADTVAVPARQVAEWALVRRLARNLVHSLSKADAGWSEEDIKAIQSPEAMSLLIDDVEMQLPLARQRLAILLGLASGEEVAVPREPSASSRAAAQLAEAEARLQRAIASNSPGLGADYRRVATILTRQGDQAAARDWLEKGIVADPNSPWCHYDLADLLMREGDFGHAAQAAAEAVACGNSNHMSLFRRRQAAVERQRGDHEKACRLLEEAIADDPDKAGLYVDLSDILLANGHLDRAANVAEAAFSLGTDKSGLAARHLARVEMRRGNPDRAHALLTEAVSNDPADIWSRRELVRLLTSRHDFAAARALIRKALESDRSDRAFLLRSLSDLEKRQGDRITALTIAEEASAEIPDDPTLHVQRVHLLLSLNDLDGAEDAIEAAMEAAPAPSSNLLRLRAVIAARQGDYVAGRRWIDRALEVDEGDPAVWLELAGQLAAQRDYEAADKAIDAALPVVRGSRTAFLRRRSEIAFKAGDASEAARWLEEAIAGDPADPALFMDLSKQHLETGRLEAALEMAQAALKIAPSPATRVLRRCAEIELRRGNEPAARAWLDRAISSAPSDPQLWVDLSGLLARTGDLPGARHAAEKAVELKSPKVFSQAS